MRAIGRSIRKRQLGAMALWLFGVALVAGCAGKTHSAPPVPGEPVDAGTDSGRVTPEHPPDAGTDAGRNTPSDAGDAGVSNQPRACPGRGEPRPAQCSDKLIDLPLVQGASVALPDGTVVEALQVPSFTEANHVVTWESVPPESWDRSEIPAGACVFRLHGLHASCYADQNYGSMFVGTCQRNTDHPPISPGSYYENGCKAIAPGCTTANWGGGGSDGYWWYLNSRPDAIDIVICAPQCGGSYFPGGACLQLYGPR